MRPQQTGLVSYSIRKKIDMRILVTGGAGFIGSHIVDGLLEKEHQVLVLDNFSSGLRSNLEQAFASFSAKIEVCEADICSEEAANAIKNYKPDAVIHHAAQINVRSSVSDPAFDAEKNVVGTVKILSASASAGCRKVLFASTGGAIYGEQDVFPAPEGHPVRPESPYGVSKRAAELYLDYFARKCGIGVVVLRYSNVFGPRQNPKGEAGVVAIFCRQLLEGKPLVINGDGGQTRDFVFVKDVVAANLLALDATEEGALRMFNVGVSTETSVNQLAESLKDVWEEYSSNQADLTTGVEILHREAAQGEQRRSVIDVSFIRRELGWSPKVDLRAGLKQTLLHAASTFRP